MGWIRGVLAVCIAMGLGVCAGGSDVYAGVEREKINMLTPDGTLIETEVYAADTPDELIELGQIADAAEKQAEEALAAQPEIPRDLALVTKVQGNRINRVKDFIQGHKWLEKNWLTTLTVMRFTVVTGVVFTSMVFDPHLRLAAHPPLLEMTVTSVFGGLMSAWLMIRDPDVQEFMTSNPNMAVQLGKYVGIEIAWLSFLTNITLAMGLPVAGETGMDLLINIGESVVLGTASQGSAELANALWRKIREKMDPKYARFHQMISNARVLALSGIGAFLSVGNIVEMPGAELGMYAMTGVAIAAYIHNTILWSKTSGEAPPKAVKCMMGLLPKAKAASKSAWKRLFGIHYDSQGKLVFCVACQRPCAGANLEGFTA